MKGIFYILVDEEYLWVYIKKNASGTKGKIIGLFNLGSSDRGTGLPGFSYFIQTELQGMGYGTEAFSTLLKFVYSLPCVSGNALVTNYPFKDNYTDFNSNSEEPPILVTI
jgi:RimJ/RimL family protein N-acetyltransferase